MVVKEMLLEGLKEALRRDARNNIAKGTMKIPVDVEEFATRLEKAPLRSFFVFKGKHGLNHEDYVQAIKGICGEFGLGMKDESTEQTTKDASQCH